MPDNLTSEDRAALEAAAIVLTRLCQGPVKSISIGCNGRGHGRFLTTSVLDKYAAFMPERYPSNPAQLCDAVSDLLAKVHAANPDEETRKAQRIVELREQLSRLEGEAA